MSEEARRGLAKKQLALVEKIKSLANINIVTCGHCGTILLHEIRPIHKDNTIVCFGCLEKMDLCHCPDYWYKEMIENEEFN